MPGYKLQKINIIPEEQGKVDPNQPSDPGEPSPQGVNPWGIPSDAPRPSNPNAPTSQPFQPIPTGGGGEEE